MAMVKKITKIIRGKGGYFLTVILLPVACCLPPVFSFAATQDKTVRIAILQDAKSFYLRIKGNFEMRDLSAKRLIRKGKGFKKQKVEARAGKLVSKDITISASRIQIVPFKGGTIYINNRAYRGSINFIRKGSSGVLVVNELPLEDYVQGILCKEIAPWWPMDALKAQAVIARTYALYQMQFTKSKDFDLTNDIYSQVYGGKTSEKWRTNRAVALTKGKILTFKGSIFPTYYHATCSGHTEDAAALWNVDLAPLKGVVCGFCGASPHLEWKKEIPLGIIASKLRAKGHQCPEEIEDIEIINRNNSGRVIQLRLKGKDNTFLEISAKDFRQALDPNTIRSANFAVKVVGAAAHIEGLGWGHGVGLCQWGMYFMAKEGSAYEHILAYYFPQSEMNSIK